MTTFIKQHCIALTGGIATGKTTVGEYLSSTLGYVVINADLEGHAASLPGTDGYEQILKEFGSGILRDDESESGLPMRIDRKKLGAIVFNDAAKKKRLENIMHPLIEKGFHESIKTWGLLEDPELFFYESALIYEMGKEHEFKEVWCTFCSLDVQRERLMQRSFLTREEADSRIAAQMPAARKAELADRVIWTHPCGGSPTVEQQIDRHLKRLGEIT